MKPPRKPQAPWDEKDYGEKTCPYCDGDGHDPEDNRKLCSECDGTGMVPKDFDDIMDDYYDAEEKEWEYRMGR